MQKTKLFKGLSLLLCFLLIAAMAIFASGCRDNSSEISETHQFYKDTGDTIILGEGATTFNFSVFDKDGGETKFVINTDKKTVHDALTEHNLIDGEMGAYGLYVKTVNGITVDFDKDKKYWAFYINGEYSTSGVDSTTITKGATYSFKVE